MAVSSQRMTCAGEGAAGRGVANLESNTIPVLNTDHSIKEHTAEERRERAEVGTLLLLLLLAEVKIRVEGVELKVSCLL